MKSTIFLLISILICVGSVKSQDTRTLTLVIENINSFDSKLYVGIYKNQKDFKNKVNAIDSAIVVPKEKTFTLTFKTPNHQYYAAAGFQDLNHNGKLDTGIFGIPVEPVCVSDYDHKPKSPPTFKKSEFYFLNDTTIVMPLMSGNKEVEKLEKEL